MTKEEQLYEEEEKTLRETKKILKEKNLSSDQLYGELDKFVSVFEELLNNAKLITLISDRFQEKLNGFQDIEKWGGDSMTCCHNNPTPHACT